MNKPKEQTTVMDYLLQLMEWGTHSWTNTGWIILGQFILVLVILAIQILLFGEMQ